MVDLHEQHIQNRPRFQWLIFLVYSFAVTLGLLFWVLMFVAFGD